jgi:hypothetical protein
MNDIRYSKICPSCRDIVYYKTKGSYYANHNKNTPCRKCKGRAHSTLLMGRSRIPFSKKWKRNLATSHKNSEIWKTSMNTPEYKEKHRQKMLRMIREGKSSVAFNPNACDVFDFINNKLGWNGQHAKNGKEKVVDVFFLDYYNPQSNVAIEWDEKHHRKATCRKRDGFKSKIVMEILGCEFYRVDAKTKIVCKVDRLSSNHTEELQKVISEYYEGKKQS